MNVDVALLKVFDEVKQYVKMTYDYVQTTILVKDMLIFDVCIHIEKKVSYNINSCTRFSTFLFCLF